MIINKKYSFHLNCWTEKNTKKKIYHDTSFVLVLFLPLSFYNKVWTIVAKNLLKKQYRL